MTYITIDGGTSSTRISLVEDNRIKHTLRLPIGVRKGIEGGTVYSEVIRDGIKQVLSDCSICEKDVFKILASGMITSEFGLCNLPHLSVPAGLSELHYGLYETAIPEVSAIPFVFVRGVKSISDDLSETDMMRGEETELFGIMSESYGECIYVLPGSHSKIIRTDINGRIVAFSTMLTGEMLFALSQSTILKDAVDLSTNTPDTEYLLLGDAYARKNGINEALFKVRILKNLFGADSCQCYSFFMGAVLSAELSKIAAEGADTVVIGGRSQIKRAMAEILRTVTDKKIICIDDEAVDKSTVSGLIKIYEYEVKN